MSDRSCGSLGPLSHEAHAHMRSAERLRRRTASKPLRLRLRRQVRWQPTKLLPPMSDEEWAAEFEEYKKFPEFQVGAYGQTASVSLSVDDATTQCGRLSLANIRKGNTVRKQCDWVRGFARCRAHSELQAEDMSTWPIVREYRSVHCAQRKARHTVPPMGERLHT